jgi:drug/metabolite transporter (DMT)-like permease
VSSALGEAGRTRVTTATLVSGVLWAMVAGAGWGLAFIAAPLLPGWSAIEITAGRYTAYGVFAALALLVAARGTAAVQGLRDAYVWRRACILSLVGNLLYFVLVTAGIQRAGAAIAALIIGTLPVLLPVAANLRTPTFRFERLILPGVSMLAGIIAVHVGEHGGWSSGPIGTGYWIGIGLIVAALLAWTWYGMANAEAVQSRGDVTAATWASLQGVALLPFVAPVFAWSFATHAPGPGQASVATFLLVSALLGIVTSWVAMWCWNRASQLLPAALAGPLIVFETLSALVYAYSWKAEWPPLLVVLGAALLLAGVVVGLRRLR